MSIRRRGALQFAVFSALMAFGLGAATCVRADDDSRTTREIWFGVDFGEFQYSEFVPAPLKSTETGLIPEIYYGMKWKWNSGWNLNLETQVSPFSTQYNGTTQEDQYGNVQPVTGTTHSLFFNLESTVSYPVLSIGDWMEIRPYLGLGMRFWQRGDGSTDTNNSVSYEEDYSWFYAPIGILFQFKPTEYFSVGLDFSLRPTFGGNIDIHLSEISPNPDESLGLGSKVGAKIQLPVVYRWDRWQGMINPWFEYSAIGQSDPITIVADDQGDEDEIFEPNSRTSQYGITVSAGFTY